MKRIVIALLVALGVAGAQAEEKKLNVFIWSEYIDPQIVADFEKEFGCKVALDLYEDNESMIAKLAGGGTALYDIVVPSDYVITAMVKRGLLAELRHANLPNLKHVDPTFASPPFDPGNKFTAPYQWGTVGLYVRLPEGKTIPTSWSLLFNPKEQPGPFLLMDDMRPCFSAALRYKGHSVNSTDPKELKEARDLLLEAKKRSLGR